jgi:hypothetical protein
MELLGGLSIHPQIKCIIYKVVGGPSKTLRLLGKFHFEIIM